MTVKELIKKLEVYNEDMEVCVYDTEWGTGYLTEIYEVEYFDKEVIVFE